MTITYLPLVIESGSKITPITFVNSTGGEYTRSINIPYNEDGSIDQITLDEIVQGQLLGVIQKNKLGLITFMVTENTGSTE